MILILIPDSIFYFNHGIKWIVVDLHPSIVLHNSCVRAVFWDASSMMSTVVTPRACTWLNRYMTYYSFSFSFGFLSNSNNEKSLSIIWVHSVGIRKSLSILWRHSDGKRGPAFSIMMHCITELFPGASDDDRRRVIWKLDNGVGRNDNEFLFDARQLGIFVYPGLPNTSEGTQEMDCLFAFFQFLMDLTWLNS